MHPETLVRPVKCDRGSVVMEAALVIPVLLVVTVLLVWVVSLGATYVRVLDVAQTAARQAARGMETTPAQRDIAVVVTAGDGLVQATASQIMTPPLAAFTGWSFTVRASAHAMPEWSPDIPAPMSVDLP
jgi:Flp pilus assembly protein TadG